MPYPLSCVPFERTASTCNRKLSNVLPPGISSQSNLLLSSSKVRDPLPIFTDSSPGFPERSQPLLLFWKVSPKMSGPFGVAVGVTDCVVVVGGGDLRDFINR